MNKLEKNITQNLKELKKNCFLYFSFFCLLSLILSQTSNPIESAEDYIDIPDDPKFAESWHLQSSTTDNLTTNWLYAYQLINKLNIEPKQEIIRFALIDSGLNINHPDIAYAVETNDDEPIDGIDNDNDGYIDNRHGCAFTPEDNSCKDASVDESFTQHGTVVAGVLAAQVNNAIGVAGSSYGFQPKLVPIKVIQRAGYANYSDITEALEYVIIDGNFDVVVISIAGHRFFDSHTKRNELLRQISEQGTIIVAGSGNSAVEFEGVGWPGRHPEVISVGATDKAGSRKLNSNFGPRLDLVAPGEWIDTICYYDEYCSLGGTSLSAPQVAAAVALILSQRPKATFNEVQEILHNTSSGEYSEEMGHGILNFKEIAKHLFLPEKIYLPQIANN
jgi:serine protease